MQASAVKVKHIFVLKIVNSVVDNEYTKEHQVLALRKVIKHKELRTICVCAGVVVAGLAPLGRGMIAVEDQPR